MSSLRAWRRALWSWEGAAALVVLGAVASGGVVALGVVDSGDVSGTPLEPAVSGVEELVGGPWTPDGIDERAVEDAINDRVNDERTARQRTPLDRDGLLSEDAREHSRLMAEHDFVGHDDPRGRTLRERTSVGCRTLGENVAMTWVFEEVETAEGRDRYTSASEAGAGLVRQWMHSEGHRQNLLDAEFAAQGVGVHVTEGGKVYATQILCG